MCNGKYCRHTCISLNWEEEEEQEDEWEEEEEDLIQCGLKISGILVTTVETLSRSLRAGSP